MNTCRNTWCTAFAQPPTLPMPGGPPATACRRGQYAKRALQCKSCWREFNITSNTSIREEYMHLGRLNGGAKHEETTETTLIFERLVSNVPFRRLLEIAGISADRLYRWIEFLADQCRLFSAHRQRRLHKAFAGRNRIVATDVQTILVNWRHAERILNVPILHAVTSDRSSGFIMAATTDYDEEADPAEAEQEFIMVGTSGFPEPGVRMRAHGR